MAVEAVGRGDAARVKVEVVGVASIRERSRRPIVPAACVPQRPREDVPAGMEIQRRLSNPRSAIGAH